MRFSILIPTRNRLDLLRYAVGSILRQEFSDWELVISDNDSGEDIGSYVSGLHDPRIRYVRQAQFVPVTDNWNHALAHSTGDYVVMLGDDDILLPGCLGKLAALIEKHSSPDVIYVEAVQFAYPGVMPGHPGAFLQTGYCEFMGHGESPFLLAPEAARAAVEKSMAMRLSYSFNMQHSFVNRAAIERLVSYGPFYQSPYPDYYATNVLLLTARSVLVVPEPLVAIGISPKSFGYYYFNRREEEGTALLNNLSPSAVPERLRGVVLPGSTLLTCWFLAMASVEQNFGREYGVHADPARYRYLQLLPMGPKSGLGLFLQQCRHLSVGELLRFAPLSMMLHLALLLFGSTGARFRNYLLSYVGPFPRFDARKRAVGSRNILELFNDWERIRGA